MTTNNHTPIATGESNAPATINTRLSTLDGAIGNLAALTTSDKSSAVAAANELRTLMNTAIAAATVDSEVVTARGAETVLLDRLTVLEGSRVNARSAAHGATGNGTTDDTQALLSALGVSFTTIVSGSGTSITVASATAFSNGDDIEITQDNDTIHKTTVSGAPSGNVITLTDALTDTVTAGNLVVRGINGSATNDGKITELPPGTYIISRPLPWNRSLYGSKAGKTIIAASASFVGTMMIDLEDAPLYLNMSNLTLDANSVSGLQCLGSDTGQDGSVARYEFVEFKNTATGTYAIGTTNSGSGNGMFVGAVFQSCYWTNCSQWILIPNQSDDVLFLNCRFYAPSTGPNATGYYVDTLGKNVRFQGCFFKLATTNNTNDIWWRMQGGQIAIENSFIEESGTTDVVHLFYPASPNQRLSIRNCLLFLTNDPTTINNFVFYPTCSSATVEARVEIANVWSSGTSGGVSGIKLIQVSRSGTITADNYVQVVVNNNAGFDDTWYTLSNNTTDGIMMVSGTHNGITYDHRVTSTGLVGSNPSTSIWPADVLRLGGNMQMVTSSTLTVADDAVGTFDSLDPANLGLYYLLVPVGNNATFCGVFMGSGTGAPLAVGIGGNLNLSSATLTGTTGTDGRITISPNGSSTTFTVENRAGAARTIFLFCLSRIV